LGYVLAGIAKIKRLEEKFYLPSVILDSQTYNRSSVKSLPISVPISVDPLAGLGVSERSHPAASEPERRRQIG
jgi:hypothetical protein